MILFAWSPLLLIIISYHAPGRMGCSCWHARPSRRVAVRGVKMHPRSPAPPASEPAPPCLKTGEPVDASRKRQWLRPAVPAHRARVLAAPSPEQAQRCPVHARAGHQHTSMSTASGWGAAELGLGAGCWACGQPRSPHHAACCLASKPWAGGKGGNFTRGAASANKAGHFRCSTQPKSLWRAALRPRARAGPSAGPSGSGPTCRGEPAAG